MPPSYQLTSHEVGSKREFWALSWPLMLGLVSSTLMIFVDRLFLARYHPLALNASASAGIAYWLFLMIPMGIVTIAEVLVGRLHGENKFSQIGSAAWQMIWASLFFAPLFFLISWAMPPLLFSGSGNEINEIPYFQTLLYFAPAQCITIALSGFFIGTGHVKTVTASALLGNFINIGLDYCLIFGIGPFPSLGIIGAAIATGTSQVVQVLFLLALFLSHKNRGKYGTQRVRFHLPYFLEGVKIGTPSGLGHFMEVLAHFLFFRIVMSVGMDQMTLVTMVQSFYILISFISDAQSKSASAVISNLLGAKVNHLIGKVLRSGATLHLCFSAFFIGLFLLIPDFFFHLFSSPEHQNLLSDPAMRHSFIGALFFMGLFFLFDGLNWILVGCLTSAGDTRYVFLIGTLSYWIAYLLPIFWLVGHNKGGADIAWSIGAFSAFICTLLYVWRYRSQAWLKRYRPLSTESA